MSVGSPLLTRLQHISLAGIRERLRDPLFSNWLLMMLTTALSAGSGMVLWMIAARLASAEAVGVAGPLVTAFTTLAVFALVGLNYSCLQLVHRSPRPGDDMACAIGIVAAASIVATLIYLLALAIASPILLTAFTQPWMIAAYVVMCAASTVNILTDSLFLAVQRVPMNLFINGVLMAVLKITLPWVLVSAGAFGILSSAGLATLVAACVSVATLLLPYRHDRVRLRPSPELRASAQLSGASYVSHILDLLPILILPPLVAATLGAKVNAAFVIGVQIVWLLNLVVVTLGGSLFAEGARSPSRLASVSTQSLVGILVLIPSGAAVLWVSAPWILAIFGSTYVDLGVPAMRVFALGSIAFGVHHWATIILRLVDRNGLMLVIQGSSFVLTLGLALVLVQTNGTVGVAAAYSMGHLVAAVIAGVAVIRALRARSNLEVGVPSPS